jgi:succinate dehydrogenase / fumarate reductase membrane anchor subunit
VRLVAPIYRVLGLGSVTDAVKHWWVQRLSAVALALLGLWLVFAFLGLPDLGYVAVVGWMQAPLTTFLMILTLATLGYHSQLGVQAVIEDYVHAAGLKTLALVLSTFAHIGVVVAGVFAVLNVAFRATG